MARAYVSVHQGTDDELRASIRDFSDEAVEPFVVLGLYVGEEAYTVFLKANAANVHAVAQALSDAVYELTNVADAITVRGG